MRAARSHITLLTQQHMRLFSSKGLLDEIHKKMEQEYIELSDRMHNIQHFHSNEEYVGEYAARRLSRFIAWEAETLEVRFEPFAYFVS